MHTQHPLGPLCMAAVGRGGEGYHHKRAKAHATGFAMSN